MGELPTQCLQFGDIRDGGFDLSIKTILAAASGGTASDGAVELACRLAKGFDACLEALHVRLDPREILAATAGDGFGVGMPLAGEWMERTAADAADPRKQDQDGL